MSLIRFGRGGDAVRRGLAAEKSRRLHGPIGVGESPWPATDAFGRRRIIEHRSEAHEPDPLTKYDYMIKALASDRADQSFRIAVLPRRSRRCRSVANAHRANAPNECLAVDAVAITNEVLRRALPTESLRDLLGDPFGSRVGSDAEPQDASTAMSKNEQSIQQPK